MSLDIRPPRRVRPLTKEKSFPLKPVKNGGGFVDVDKSARQKKKAQSGQLKWVVIMVVVIVLLLLGIVMIRKVEQSEVYYIQDKISAGDKLTENTKEAVIFDRQKWRQDFSNWQNDFNHWQELSAIVNQLIAEVDDLDKIIMGNEKEE